MKCGNCKDSHATVADVRACYEHSGRNTVQEQTQRPPWASQKPKPDPKKDWGFPAGRYAILLPGAEHQDDFAFFKVDVPTEGRWEGYTFVKQQASDDLYPVKGERRVLVLETIAKDPRKAMLDYGRKIGKCGHCGRTLTDDESRAYGIGPVCRVKVRF